LLEASLNKVEIFSGLINNETVNSLKAFVNKNLQIIYSPGMKVYKDKTESISFSIPLVDKENESDGVIKWINFKSNFVKTLDDQSFRQLTVEVSNYPDKIKLREGKGKKILMYPFSSYMVHIGAGWTIEKIEMYQKTDNWISFKQVYDYAIVFYLPGKREFCIHTDEKEKDILLLRSDKNFIEQIKGKGTVGNTLSNGLRAR